MKRRILLNSNDRAERGLLMPVMIELQKRDDVEAKWCSLPVDSPMWNKLKMFEKELDDFKPDIVIVPCDRFEAVYAAATAFHKGYFVFHFHAGNNPANHPDDINRKAISAFSHIMFANMDQHKRNLIYQGEEAWRIKVVGSTAFDHIECDDSITPKKPFDLIILHPEPDSEEKTKHNLQEVNDLVKNSHRTIIWIMPNHDLNHEIIERFLLSPHNHIYYGIKVYNSLPRPNFLSLLKNCKRAIGNSSSFYYELPILNPKAKRIQIGDRNKGLVVPPTQTGGSRKIAEILATIPLTEKLMKKWLTI